MTGEQRTCWICGSPANSREHKFKRSDLPQSGKPWTIADQPYFVGEKGWRRIQGPDSALVKFGKVLCEQCNTTRSQPFDRAYERFSAWVNQKDAELLQHEELDFTEIYGANFEPEVLNLIRYFAKHLGCRIASDNYSLPPNLGTSLAGDDLAPFEVSFARNPELAGAPIRGRGVLYNFPLIGMASPTTGVVHEPYISGMVVGYLDVIYRYNYRRRFAWEGDPLVPSNSRVRLGEFVSGMPHLSMGQIPGADTDRRVQIGGITFDIPVFDLDQIKQISSLPLPTPRMNPVDAIDAKLKIAHAILSPFYPDVTIDFLEENLTIPDADRLWRLVFPSAD
jgi:hypothetical protein